MEKLRQSLIPHVPVSLRQRIAKVFRGRGNWLSWVVYGKATYNQDGLVTAHNADFMKDPRFITAYNKAKSTNSWGRDVHWRIHILCWAAHYASTLSGDYVECGVHRGGSALATMEYINFEKQARTYFLLDTFQGLDPVYISDEEAQQNIKVGQWGYQDSYQDVVDTFQTYPNVQIIKGSVPDTLPQVTTENICYLAIDMNNRIPEIAAAEYFWDKLVPGAVIILDDYGWRKHIEQKLAFDMFAREREVTILSLPTGQGLVFKPHT